MKTRKINTYVLFTVVFQKGRFEKKITTSNYKIYNCKSIKSLHIYLIFAKKNGWLAKNISKNHNTFYTLVGVLNTSNSSGADYMSLCFNSC